MNYRICSGYHKMLQSAILVRAGTEEDSAMRRTKFLDQKRGVFPAHLHNHEYELTNYLLF